MIFIMSTSSRAAVGLLAILASILASSIGPTITTTITATTAAASYRKTPTGLHSQADRSIGGNAGGAGENSGGSQSPPTLSPPSATPYWRRPGCHQVGHTRTISIPGCVKFNLSTNACRGFCMSFSIPTDEDIGPLGLISGGDELNEPRTGDSGASGGGVSDLDGPPPVQQLLATFGGSGSEFANYRTNEALRRARDNPMDLRSIGGSSTGHQDLEAGTKGLFHSSGIHEVFRLISGKSKRSEASDKRDIVSVGQCCNMMETEDVTVNLRCGFNETRKLVFKSAKTCECFFCKHV